MQALGENAAVGRVFASLWLCRINQVYEILYGIGWRQWLLSGWASCRRRRRPASAGRFGGKLLYDFADIESWDPDGNFYRYPHDNCDYYSAAGVKLGNWAEQWQNSHTEGQDWYDCPSAHSKALNANLKAYAAWWLWARIAGWDTDAGQGDDGDSSGDGGSSASEDSSAAGGLSGGSGGGCFIGILR